VPLQSPEATQLVTPLLVQLSVALSPDCTLDALVVNVTLGATASPERLTVEEPPAPSCAISSVAFFEPAPAVGLNVTERVQLPSDAGSPSLQLLVCVYESAATPVILIPLIFSGTGPVLLSVTVCAAVSISVAVLAKVKAVGLTLTTGNAPVPLKLTVWGLPAASLAILSVAL
jgi:hypothetical protein